MAPPLTIFSLLVTLGTTAFGVPVKENSTAVEHKAKYDYIIVGGGLSGLVVANRLTENRKGMFEVPFVSRLRMGEPGSELSPRSTDTFQFPCLSLRMV